MSNFLDYLGLESEKFTGKGFNNSTQYVFDLKYKSIMTNRKENIKFEISLRQPPMKSPTIVNIKHFYQDPFSGKDLFPQGKILALSLEECVAEKLKAAISRRTPAIRDFYDLGHFIKRKFDFRNPKFLKMVDDKLLLDECEKDYSVNLGLTALEIQELKRSVSTDLIPMIRIDEEFDLESILEEFNRMFKKK